MCNIIFLWAMSDYTEVWLINDHVQWKNTVLLFSNRSIKFSVPTKLHFPPLINSMPIVVTLLHQIIFCIQFHYTYFYWSLFYWHKFFNWRTKQKKISSQSNNTRGYTWIFHCWSLSENKHRDNQVYLFVSIPFFLPVLHSYKCQKTF